MAVPPGEGESHHQLENQDHQGQIKVDIHTADLLRKTGKSAQVGEEGEGGSYWAVEEGEGEGAEGVEGDSFVKHWLVMLFWNR